jgi:DNA-binding NtrC family response regulator
VVTRKRSVLVVDDEYAMRVAMGRVLERAGFEITRAESAEVAIEALRARPWDAMVSDIRMPGMDGRELLSRALALRPELKVVLVTAYGTVEDAVQAVRRGASDYLLKPFAPEALTGFSR